MVEMNAKTQKYILSLLFFFFFFLFLPLLLLFPLFFLLSSISPSCYPFPLLFCQQQLSPSLLFYSGCISGWYLIYSTLPVSVYVAVLWLLELLRLKYWHQNVVGKSCRPSMNSILKWPESDQLDGRTWGRNIGQSRYQMTTTTWFIGRIFCNPLLERKELVMESVRYKGWAMCIKHAFLVKDRASFLISYDWCIGLTHRWNSLHATWEGKYVTLTHR